MGVTLNAAFKTMASLCYMLGTTAVCMMYMIRARACSGHLVCGAELEIFMHKVVMLLMQAWEHWGAPAYYP